MTQPLFRRIVLFGTALAVAVLLLAPQPALAQSGRSGVPSLWQQLWTWVGQAWPGSFVIAPGDQQTGTRDNELGSSLDPNGVFAPGGDNQGDPGGGEVGPFIDPNGVWAPGGDNQGDPGGGGEVGPFIDPNG